MSFAHLDLEAQAHAPSALQLLPREGELDGIIAQTALLIQQFGQLVLTFESQRRLVGTRRDCDTLRSNIDSLVTDIYRLSQAICDLLARLSHALLASGAGDVQASPRQIIVKDRLAHDHEELEAKFGAAVKAYNEKKKTVPLAKESTRLLPHSGTVDYTSEPQGLAKLQTQQQEQSQQLIDDNELEYHTLLTQDREREINAVSEGILQVNAIFRDLGALVNQQGEQLDTVENNITQFLDNTRGADRELASANEHQRKKGKWTCILLTALCIATLIVVLAVLS